MVLGMSLATFTLAHVVISLIGIATGLVVVFGMLGSKRLPGWTAVFLFTTVLTSVTGYFFPFEKVLPSHIVGGLSLVVLAVALYALYGKALVGSWRWIYVVTAVFAQYLNSFVGVVQTFLKQSAFHALAPTQTEPPFLLAQGATLIFYGVVGFLAVRKFHPR